LWIAVVAGRKSIAPAAGRGLARLIAVADKCLALAISLLILGQAYLVRRWVGTWLFPACIFGLFWFGYTSVPLVLMFPVRADPYAIAYLFLCSVAFSLGSLPFNWRAAFQANGLKSAVGGRPFDNAFLRGALGALTLAALAFIALDFSSQGIGVLDLLTHLRASATSYAARLYSGSLVDNPYGRLGMVCTYVIAVLGGLQWSSAATKVQRTAVFILSFLPAVLVGLTQTTKGLLFFCAALFYAGLLIARLHEGSLRLSGTGAFRVLAYCAGIFVPVVAFAALLRGFDVIGGSGVMAGRLYRYVASYSCGHLYAFSDWFASVIGRTSTVRRIDLPATPGLYTFTAFVRLLKLGRPLPLGIYEFYTDGRFMHSNIYTMFRGLILDFGIGGSLLFMLVIGLGFHWSFRVLLVRPRPVVTVVIFSFMMAFIYSSFIVSILGWTRIYVALVLLWALLQVNSLQASRSAAATTPPAQRNQE
jgi:oligosaccharide repeat unit polymerase